MFGIRWLDWIFPFLFCILPIPAKYWSLIYPESDLIISHRLSRLRHLLVFILDKLITWEDLKCSLPFSVMWWPQSEVRPSWMYRCVNWGPYFMRTCIWHPRTWFLIELHPVAVSCSGWQRVWSEAAHFPIRERLLQINSWCLCHMGGLFKCLKRLSRGLKHFRSSGELCPEAEMRGRKNSSCCEDPNS